jgi:4-aminobutyrate aminotransferase/(S)-3-amino-2-methylpropionate transaminase
MIEKEGLLARSAAIGRRFEERARGWQKKWSLVGDVRSLGGMCAIELVRNAETLEPADIETEEVTRYCYEHGLIIIRAGTYANVIRILVPLVISDEQFDEGLGVIEAALASVKDRRSVVLSRV